MGKVFFACAENTADIDIVCGIDKDPQNCHYPFPVYASVNEIQEEADCLIDFSNRQCIYDYLPFAIEKKLPCVIASTGFTDEDLAYIASAAKETPILRSGNMSLGVNILLQLSKMCAKAIGNQADIEIVEQHHRRKLDAPSGTALLLAEGIQKELPDATFNLGRSGLSPRQKNEIGISAVRGGTIVGKHEVMFILDSEVITLKHEAESRQIFANGSMTAARFIVKKTPALYSMEDIFND